MATPAQIDANRRNARSSTGPKSEDGKAKSSRNATKFSLFATNNCVLPEQEEFYAAFCQEIWEALGPEGPLEELAAAEFIRAAWRLCRCVCAEEQLGNFSVRQNEERNARTGEDRPPVDPAVRSDCASVQTSIDRARTQACNIQRRAKADLDKLQALRKTNPIQPTEPAREPVAPEAAAPESAAPTAAAAKRTQSKPDFPCPCGSNLHFELCCGAVPPPEPGSLRAELHSRFS